MRESNPQTVSNNREIVLVILSGVGNAFQYIFLLILCGTALVYTADLVAADKLSSDVFSIIVGGIVTGCFALMNPRGRRETPEKELPQQWNGIDRRREE